MVMPLTWNRRASSLARAGAPDVYRMQLARQMFPLGTGDGVRALACLSSSPACRISHAPSRIVQTACRMDLYSQAQNLGILTQFVDGQGQTRLTDEAALKIIIDALPPRAERRIVAGPVV